MSTWNVTTVEFNFKQWIAHTFHLCHWNSKNVPFQHYRCDRNRTLGLNMASVSKVFKLCGNDDAVILRHEDDGDNVTFVFESAGEDRLSDFDLKLMQIDQEHLGVPEAEFQATIEMPSDELKRICVDLANFADSVTMSVSKDGLKFTTKGEIGGGSIVLKPKNSTDKRDAVSIRATETVNLTFALRYLNYFAKATPLSRTVRLQMSTGQPLEVMFTILDDEAKGSIKFYLAPKTDDETAANSMEE
eukprot:Platyproteum_vivax@DN10878_c0_g1_i1.p1